MTTSVTSIENRRPARSESIDAHEHLDTFDWEIVPEKPLDLNSPKMKHIMSTPNLTHLDALEDDSYTFVSDDVLSESSTEQQTPKQPVPNSMPKRHPSFKDAILLNADETRNEIQLKKEQQEKARLEALKNRSRSKNIKFVVKPIKRCTKSTGDLRSLIKVEEDEDGYCGGGGGGCVTNDMVLGDSDASEFYANKGHARVSRKNNQKLRPDEAKRREMIIYKKNMQRQAQQSKSNGKK